MSETPLVTFALFTYNQEAYVEEAVKSALAQDYTGPLEILISDDCSKDRTYELIQTLTASYDGPAKLILNRNEKNLGIGGHINKIMDLSSGELIVIAAGDDISVPSRTSEIVSAWQESGGERKSIYSDALTMKENGEPDGKMERQYHEDPLTVLKKEHLICGCSHSWTRDIFRKFPPLENDVVAEDVVLSFRSLLLGKVHRIEKPLVKYRKCGSEWKNGIQLGHAFEHHRHKGGICKIATYRQIIRDLEHIAGSLDETIRLKLLGAAKAKLYENQLFVQLIDHGVWKSSPLLLRGCSRPKSALRALKRYFSMSPEGH